MKLFKTKFVLSVSTVIAISLPVFLSTACSSDEDAPRSSVQYIETNYSNNDTVYVDGAISDMHKTDFDAASPSLKEFVATSLPSASRAIGDLEVYSFLDETSEKEAIAIGSPSKPNVWIYECQSRRTGESVIIIFEEISSNEFVVKDEKGEVLRTFTYNPEAHELWTFDPQNPTSRAFSSRSFLCNTAFSAAAFLVCEALAVPSGGATLAVGLGFVVASSYLC